MPGDEDVLRGLYDRINSGDRVGAAAMLHPGAELHQNPEMPDADVYVGREAFKVGLEKFLEEWSDFRFEPTEIERGELSWMRIALTGRGRTSGIELNQEIFHVWEMRDGKPFKCLVILDEAESRREAGLGE